MPRDSGAFSIRISLRSLFGIYFPAYRPTLCLSVSYCTGSGQHIYMDVCSITAKYLFQPCMQFCNVHVNGLLIVSDANVPVAVPVELLL